MTKADDSLLTADPEACKERKSKLDLISRAEAIEAIEIVDWYHQNSNNDMVHGANDDEHQAWYKAEDVYKALEAIPSATSEEFRGRLARSIKAAGRWIEDNAEGIAGTIDGRSSLDIRLSWECSGQEITPDINIDGDFLCREAIEEMFKHE